MTTGTDRVTGMTCDHCVRAVTDEVSKRAAGMGAKPTVRRTGSGPCHAGGYGVGVERSILSA